jgi:metaxin
LRSPEICDTKPICRCWTIGYDVLGYVLLLVYSLQPTADTTEQLYSIYLSPNSTSIAEPLYILSTSTNTFVRLTTAYELRRAAEAELLKHSAVINADSLYKDAEEAFDALETLLGDGAWFFGNEKPGLFDASVFSYTHLLLDDEFGRGWVDTRLRDAVLQRSGLVRHRARIADEYFSNDR